jgi:hypothetical protein
MFAFSDGRIDNNHGFSPIPHNLDGPSPFITSKVHMRLAILLNKAMPGAPFDLSVVRWTFVDE